VVAYPIDRYTFIPRFVVVDSTADIAPPRDNLACLFVADGAVPLCVFFSGVKFGTPGHIAIGYPAIGTIPKFVLTIGTTTESCLSLGKYREPCRNHVGGTYRKFQCFVFGIFGRNQDRSILTPGTIESGSSCSF